MVSRRSVQGGNSQSMSNRTSGTRPALSVQIDDDDNKAEEGTEVADNTKTDPDFVAEPRRLNRSRGAPRTSRPVSGTRSRKRNMQSTPKPNSSALDPFDPSATFLKSKARYEAAQTKESKRLKMAASAEVQKANMKVDELIADHAMNMNQLKCGAYPEDKVLSKFYKIRDGWRQWAWDHAAAGYLASICDEAKKSIAEHLVNRPVPMASMEGLQQLWVSEAGKSVPILSLLSQHLTAKVFMNPFFFLRGTDPEATGLDLQNAMWKVYREGLESNPDRAQLWRSMTVAMLHGEGCGQAEKISLGNGDQKTEARKEQYYHHVVNAFLEGPADYLLKKSQARVCERRETELFVITQELGEYTLDLWSQRPDWKICNFKDISNKAFRFSSNLLEPHGSMGIDDDKHSLNGTSIDVLLEPAFMRMGNAYGQNYDQVGTVSKAVVWLSGRQFLAPKVNGGEITQNVESGFDQKAEPPNSPAAYGPTLSADADAAGSSFGAALPSARTEDFADNQAQQPSLTVSLHETEQVFEQPGADNRLGILRDQPGPGKVSPSSPHTPTVGSGRAQNVHSTNDPGSRKIDGQTFEDSESSPASASSPSPTDSSHFYRINEADGSDGSGSEQTPTAKGKRMNEDETEGKPTKKSKATPKQSPVVSGLMGSSTLTPTPTAKASEKTWEGKKTRKQVPKTPQSAGSSNNPIALEEDREIPLV